MDPHCQARILTNYSAEKKGYSSAECGKPSTKHIWVDDGEARMFICSPCFRRWLNKGRQPTKELLEPNHWHGWFDCEPPSNSPLLRKL